MLESSTVFDLLAADHRRRILLLLCDRESLDVPADVVTRGATDAPATASTGVGPRSDRKHQRVEVALFHRHLPKLADEDVIEWDRAEGAVTRGPAFEEVEPALRTISENADRFPPDLL